MRLYREISSGIMAYFDTVTAVKERLSVDEAFLDLSGAHRLLGNPQQMGSASGRTSDPSSDCRSRWASQTGSSSRRLPPSAPSRTGCSWCRRANAFDFSTPCPSRRCGVGAKTAQALEGLGLRTVEQVAHTPQEVLQRRFGALGAQLYELAWGHDPRPVTPHRPEKSMGAEETFDIDLIQDADLHAELLDMAYRVAARLRASGSSAKGVALKLRYTDFTTLTRSSTLLHATQSAPVLYQRARGLLAEVGPRPSRSAFWASGPKGSSRMRGGSAQPFAGIRCRACR